VSDLTFEVVSNGWGPVEKNTSNGEALPNDGKTITLNGVTFEKGLGVHSRSEVNVVLGGQYKEFLADVGLDDEAGAQGTVAFTVLLDGVQVYDSGIMGADTATRNVKLDVAGKQQLKLVVTDAGDGNAADHADWAGARLVK
jgi:hypothetical protein